MELLFLFALLGTIYYACRDLMNLYTNSYKRRRKIADEFWREMHYMVDECVADGLTVKTTQSRCNAMYEAHEYKKGIAELIRPYLSRRVKAAYRDSLRQYKLAVAH